MSFESQSVENTEDKFTQENVLKAIESGKFMEVKVKRSSGEVETDWVVSGIFEHQGKQVAKVLKFKPEGGTLNKIVPLDDLKSWNS